MSLHTKLPVDGEGTPEYNAVLASESSLSSALQTSNIKEVIRQFHSLGVIADRRIQDDEVIDKVLANISVDPKRYYALQGALFGLGENYKKAISAMEKKFRAEMKTLISTPESVDYKVFLSYSRRTSSEADIAAVRGLWDELQRNGCKPWMDEKYLKAGDNLIEGIISGLKCSDILIPVLSAGYASSLWCLREFYCYSLLNKEQLVPVLLGSRDDIENEKAGKWLMSCAEALIYTRLSSENANNVRKIITAVKKKLGNPANEPVGVMVQEDTSGGQLRGSGDKLSGAQGSGEMPILKLNDLVILKYEDKGEKKNIRIISEASHKWKDIASLICDDANKIRVLEQQYQSNPTECLRQAVVENFIEKKPHNYSQDWKGLIELLQDVGLETLAKKLEYALSCK